MDWTRAVCPHMPGQTNTLLTQQLAFYLMTAAVSLSFLFSPRHAMKQDLFSGPVSTIGPKRRFNDKIFFKKQGIQRETATSM